MLRAQIAEAARLGHEMGARVGVSAHSVRDVTEAAEAVGGDDTAALIRDALKRLAPA